jgi:pectin methylesterase-like acyl-CoA thioesterase
MEKQCFNFSNLAVLLTGILLSGCACLQPSSDFSKQQADLGERCAKTDILVTDLTQPAPGRTYVLPSGLVCPGKEE